MRLDFEVTEILWGEDGDSGGECEVREDREGEWEVREDREDPGGHNTGTGCVNVKLNEIKKARVKLATCK